MPVAPDILTAMLIDPHQPEHQETTQRLKVGSADLPICHLELWFFVEVGGWVNDPTIRISWTSVGLQEGQPKQIWNPKGYETAAILFKNTTVMLKAALETGQPHKHLFCVSCLQIALGVKPFRPGLLADGARGADWAPPLGGRVGKTVRSPVTARFHPPRSMFAEGKEPSAEDLVPPTPQPCYRHIIRVTSPLARLLMEMNLAQPCILNRWLMSA
uniref:uncharacterized protein LOC118547640 n=1 Tax=Halichoerus grypus TaxID=9711 RepID=UPI001659BA59|nr:uncharacterized protein LOC118547640 [Halichoerus grypus]